MYVCPCFRLTSWACLEKESALAIMAAVLSSSSPSFWPLSSSAIRARARSPTIPEAAPFIPSMPPGPGMCWAKLRDAFPAAISPTEGGDSRENNRERCVGLMLKELNQIWQICACIGLAYIAPLCPETVLRPRRDLWRTLCSVPPVSPLVWKVRPASPETSAHTLHCYIHSYCLCIFTQL